MRKGVYNPSPRRLPRRPPSPAPAYLKTRLSRSPPGRCTDLPPHKGNLGRGRGLPSSLGAPTRALITTSNGKSQRPRSTSLGRPRWTRTGDPASCWKHGETQPRPALSAASYAHLSTRIWTTTRRSTWGTLTVPWACKVSMPPRMGSRRSAWSESMPNGSTHHQHRNGTIACPPDATCINTALASHAEENLSPR